MLPSATCIDETALAEYGEIWYQFVQYFRDSDDILISMLAVREYLRSLDHFYQVAHYDGVDEACRDRAKEALSELQFCMEEIIEAVGNKTSRPGE